MAMAEIELDCFSRLPDEICLQILQYVPKPYLFKCMRVCRRWNTLSCDDTLWKEMVLACDQVKDPDFLLKTAARWPRLTSLTFLGDYPYDQPLYSLITDISIWEVNHRPRFSFFAYDLSTWETVWKRFENLESVSFLACPPLFINSIPSLVFACAKLKCLRCEYSHDFGKQHLVGILHPHRRYRELSLAHCTQIDEVDFTGKNTNMFDCFKTLEVLNLDGLEFISDGSVLRILEKCPVLKSLTLDAEQLTDRVPQYIGNHLQSLEHLTISFCENFTDKSLLSLGALKLLKTLYFKKGERLTNEAFEGLFEQLYSAPDGDKPQGGRLRSVSLIECCGLLDSGLKKLAKNNPRLIHLDLSWCWNLTDAGLEAVAANCHHIKTLKLVGLMAANCLPIISASMPQLHFLELIQTDLVDDEQLKVMKESKPWLTIIDYYGEEVTQDKLI